MTGRTPLPNQYSGRHISHWKMNNVYVDRLAPGVTGKIQFGADPGASAQVIVPACAVPLADGTEPNAPDVVFTDPLEGVLLQAATPVARTAAHAASAVPRRGRLPGFPRDPVLRLAPMSDFSCRTWVRRGRGIAASFRRDQLRATASTVAWPDCGPVRAF